MKKIIFCLFCLFFITSSFCRQRTLYVDNFNNIIGSPSKEDKLLLFAKKNNFKTLILYQLNKVNKRWPLTDPQKNNVLAAFMSKAKSEFGIQSIGASGESASFFTKTINLYNNSRNKSIEKFDIYNLEYEYWSNKASGEDGYYCVNYLQENAISCNREGSFNYFIANLKEIKKLSKKNKNTVQIEAYLGYYTENELIEISKYCDRLLIQAHGKTPQLSFNAAKKSLQYIAKINSKIKTSVLFSTKMTHLGYWLKFDNLKNGESMFFDEMNAKNIELRKHLNLDGFSYHAYTDLERSMSYYAYSKN
ncbi:hypothetical protein ES044_16255 [Polaribacter sp. IC066]|uniref:hypothetical protein n=1 Tax=Polaribacter sp. IC066 TaxID=57032 RepID=UPI0011BFA3FE|nr:hypothetical protein [Polaribacter sp. IC066]TXD56781.1 hypothetical protein ES044_16255 [Polaribacter sp. IC066]